MLRVPLLSTRKAGSCVGEVQLLGTADGHLVMHHRSTDPQIERPGRGRILNISIDTPESGFASVLSDHENNNLYIFSFKKKRFSAKFIRLPRGLSARSQCWIPDIGTKGEPVRTLLIGTNAGSLFAYSVDVSRGEAERLQLISTAASKKPIYGIVAGKVRKSGHRNKIMRSGLPDYKANCSCGESQPRNCLELK
mmetsp:Transcript_38556/g.152099  ORF Transcript_38556/g.152099 Transcript_38556/m.152099 type:complete len:194 (+) Transcript_38556:259-840(+)